MNGPKSWSLAAELHPDIAAAYDAAQDRAAEQIIGWLGQHATTRVGPARAAGRDRGRDAGGGDGAAPHLPRRGPASPSASADQRPRLRRRVSGGGWTPSAIRDSLAAINGIGHAAVATDPAVPGRAGRARLHPRPGSGEITAARPLRRGVQQAGGADRAQPRPLREGLAGEHPGEQPGPALRRAWDARAWAEGRPDKVTPDLGRDVRDRWLDELTAPRLHAIGITRCCCSPHRSGRSTVTRLSGSCWPGWLRAGRRGTPPTSAAKSNTSRPRPASSPTQRCAASWPKTSPPAPSTAACPCSTGRRARAHPRAHLARRPRSRERPGRAARRPRRRTRPRPRGPAVAAAAARSRARLDAGQAAAVAALAGDRSLVVVEGAAGAGKTTTPPRHPQPRHRAGPPTDRGDPDVESSPGRRRRTRRPGRARPRSSPTPTGSAGTATAPGPASPSVIPTRRPAASTPVPATGCGSEHGDLLLVDEAGMLDQDTARALLTIADEAGRGSRWSGIGTSSPRSAAAGCSTSPPAGPTRRLPVDVSAPLHP